MHRGVSEELRQGMEALLEPERARAWIGDCRQPDPLASECFVRGVRRDAASTFAEATVDEEIFKK
ncbi:MAG: hypothetical protein K2U26_18155 [Cyclobacteriaceae bacterium]|nr:hypothetical protein [Cyclobacteriaceae bacterium]